MICKNYLFIVGALFIGSAATAQNTGDNYVKTTIPKIAVSDVTQVAALNDVNKHQSIKYFDGLGRPTQSILLGASPNQGDIITFIEYDEYGRKPKSYLSYVNMNTDGLLQNDPLSDQASFYLHTNRVANTGVPYSESRYENSPLNRILESSASGESWAMGSGHTINSTTRFNGSTQVHNFSWDGTKALATSYYEPNMLRYSENLDEHGGLSRTFRDKNGFTILTQDKAGTVSDPSTGLVRGVYHNTYYVYNDLDQLVMIIPPLAYEEMSTLGSYNTTVLSSDLTFEYYYDKLGRLVEEKKPNQGATYIVYDKLHRPVLTQNANQRALNEWWFTKFDSQTRPILQGKYVNSSTFARTFMQLIADQSTVLFEDLSAVDYNINQGYTNNAFPNANTEILIVNYYDDYDYDEDGVADATFDPTPLVPVHIVGRGGGGGTPLTKYNVSTDRTRGMPTGSRVKIMDVFNVVQWLTKSTFYNEKMNVIQIDALNMKGGHEVSDMFFDFEGQLTNARLRHDVNDGNIITIKNRYTYDREGRLLKTYQQNNSDPATLMVSSEYNELGKLIEKNLHNTDDGGDFLQSVDFAYNIRGWITHINNASLSNDFDIGNANTPNSEVQDIVLEQVSIRLQEISASKRSKTINATLKSSQTVYQIDEGSTEVTAVPFSQTFTIDLASSNSTDASVYADLQTLLDLTIVVDYSAVSIDRLMDLTAVINEAQIVLDQVYIDEGVQNATAQDLISFEMKTFLQNKVSLGYYNDDDDDVFGMEIKYENPSDGAHSNPQFNGNVSEIQWNTASEYIKRHYFFEYDDVNRLNDAWYSEFNSLDDTWTLGVDNYSVNNVSYDANGNIQTLNRRGSMQSGGFADMDLLTYEYEANKLQKVDDQIAAAGAINSFVDGTNTSDDYVYDDNGNLTYDANKGCSISYNRLNLPVLIDFGSGNEIHHIYAANGVKLQKIIKKVLHPDDNMWYIGSINYDNDGLKFIKSAEGRIDLNSNQSSGDEFTYQYHFKDHQGNIRLAFSDAGRDGIVDPTTDILQETHYYPFGLEFKGITAPQSQNHPYKFNGVELEEQFKLNYYMTAYRALDPQIARWTAVDPHASKTPDFSPYVAFNNNPVFFADPDGLFGRGLLDWLRGLFEERPNKEMWEQAEIASKMYLNDNVDYDGAGFGVGYTIVNQHGRFTYQGKNMWKNENFVAEGSAPEGPGWGDDSFMQGDATQHKGTMIYGGVDGQGWLNTTSANESSTKSLDAMEILEMMSLASGQYRSTPLKNGQSGNLNDPYAVREGMAKGVQGKLGDLAGKSGQTEQLNAFMDVSADLAEIDNFEPGSVVSKRKLASEHFNVVQLKQFNVSPDMEIPADTEIVIENWGYKYVRHDSMWRMGKDGDSLYLYTVGDHGSFSFRKKLSE
jgi:RHS repeat-associated protein